jgi:PAS domain S-box-containing protein
VHPDDADRIREAQRRALMDGGPVELEYRYLRGGGEVQWVRCAMNAKVNPETGKPTHFLGLITDITERKRAELAIREAAERDAFRVSLADAVRNLGDPLEIQMAASRALGMRLGVLRAYYAEWEPDGETYLVRQDWRREGVPSIAGRYRVGDFGAWLLEDYQAGRSVFVADTETDPRIDAPMRAAYAAAGVRAWASAPLLKDGRLKAVFGVNHATPRAWTPDDIAMLEETAERAWAAVERAAAEAEAKRSHDLLRTVLGSLKDPLLVYDRGGKLAYANDAFARFLGYASAEEAMEGFDRARLADFAVYDAQGAEVAPERYSGARAWRGDFQQGETLRIVDRKTGAEHWMEVTTRPLFGADGEVERIIISSYDVTALKAAHAEARAGKELLDTALNALTDSLAILDPSGRILYLNEAAARFMGYASAAEVQGTTRDALEKRVEELDESGRSLEDSESGAVRVLRCVTESETRIVQLRSPVDGRIRWVESKAAAVKDEWGRLRYVVTTAVDITRLKAAQETVSAHADRLRLALEVGRVGVWELDMHSDQLNWSDRMCAMHGRLQGQPPRSQAEFLASIHPDDRPQVMAAFLEAGPRNHFEIEYRVPGRYGDVRWLYSAGGYHRGPDGKALRFMGATIEITARKRAEDAALRMQERVRKVKHMEAIGRMAGGMSHDFNNLLTAINGYADLILSAAREDRVLQSYASNIRESGERALRITQQLLAYSQKQLLETEVADANVIVRYMIDLIRKLVDESILILPALSPAPEPIRVDPGKLKQALLHVVMNALDAMPEGGRLSLSTFFTRLAEAMDANESVIPAGNYVVIEVADTGTGIAPEILGRIFDPYFTTKPLGVKSGLGLSMVQGIVKQHGGHIQVTSEKGVGTRFRMYFPPADGTSPHPPSA